MQFDADDRLPEEAHPHLLKAVVAWFRFYKEPFAQKTADFLCRLAIAGYLSGHRGTDLSEFLIHGYVGVISTKVNAPTSIAIH